MTAENLARHCSKKTQLTITKHKQKKFSCINYSPEHIFMGNSNLMLTSVAMTVPLSAGLTAEYWVDSKAQNWADWREQSWADSTAQCSADWKAEY
jgi:hypothetical protein